jgi:hypothetical protein
MRELCPTAVHSDLDKEEEETGLGARRQGQTHARVMKDPEKEKTGRRGNHVCVGDDLYN